MINEMYQNQQFNSTNTKLQIKPRPIVYPIFIQTEMNHPNFNSQTELLYR